jgi:putative heme-binding domain-containing protein
MPSRFDGRIWRVAPKNSKPIASGQWDLAQRTSNELVDLLSHQNAWYSRQARNLLAERRDPSVATRLRELVKTSDDERLAAEALWALHVSGGLTKEFAAACLRSRHESIRAWTVRLLGDGRDFPPALRPQLVELAGAEPSSVVRSQLACTAKRLPAPIGLPIVEQLVKHDEDADDPNIPLLLWWSVEDKAISDTALVLQLVEGAETWQRPIVRQFLIARLARRFAAEGTPAGFAACAQLLRYAPDEGGVDLVVQGFVQALSGRCLQSVPADLASSLELLLQRRPSDPRVLELALRMGVQSALEPASRLVDDGHADNADRIALIHTLGQVKATDGANLLLTLLDRVEPESIQLASLSALGHFDNEQIAVAVLDAYGRLSGEPRAQCVELLCGRRTWALQLLEAVKRKDIDPKAVSLAQLRQLLEHGDERIEKLVAAHWGRVQPATALEKEGRITALLQVLGRGKGHALQGAAVFEKTCATCHKLHGKGNTVGPDLTGAERKDRAKLLRNIVDPNAMIRQQYIAHIAVTNNGRVLTGLLAETTPQTITLLDAKNKRTVLNREDLDELRESPLSLMPERLLEPLSDSQIRDLVAYLQTSGLPAEPTSSE